MTTAGDLRQLQKRIWEGCVPLEIRLASDECNTYDQSESFLVLCPRISYLPLLLPKLHAFFRGSLINEGVRPWDGWFTCEDVPMKWQFPVGLLFDIYSGNSGRLQEENGNGGKKGLGDDDSSSPAWPRTWQLVLHFEKWPEGVLARLDGDGKHLRDAFTNSYKEASFVRYSSAKVANRLSRDDATQLWEAVEKHDFSLFAPVNQKMIRPRDVELKHIPIKVYLPTAASDDDEEDKAGHVRVVQSLVSPQQSSRKPQTLGTALNSLLTTLFPSRNIPLLALPILHGAIVPLGTNLDTLSEIASYADGFLHIAVAMMI